MVKRGKKAQPRQMATTSSSVSSTTSTPQHNPVLMMEMNTLLPIPRLREGVNSSEFFVLAMGLDNHAKKALDEGRVAILYKRMDDSIIARVYPTWNPAEKGDAPMVEIPIIVTGKASEL